MSKNYLLFDRALIALNMVFHGLLPLVVSVVVYFSLASSGLWLHPTIYTDSAVALVFWYIPMEIIVITAGGVCGGSMVHVFNMLVIASGVLAWARVKYATVALVLLAGVVGGLEIVGMVLAWYYGQVIEATPLFDSELTTRVALVLGLTLLNAIWLLSRRGKDM